MLKFRKKTVANHTKHENRKQKKKLSDFNLKKKPLQGKFFFKKLAWELVFLMNVERN